MNGHHGGILFACIGPLALLTGAWVLLFLVPKTRARVRRAMAARGVVEGFLAGDPLGMPKVRYADAAGRSFTATARTGPKVRGQGMHRSVSEDQKLAIGQEVPIHYDPGDPQWIVVDAFPAPGSVHLALGVALVLIGAMTCYISFVH